MSESGQEAAHRTIERVARESYGRLVAYLSSRTRDVAGAEDALGNALVAALAHWPQDGVPQNPEAWLLTAARRSLIDVIRHQQVVLASEPTLQFLKESSTEAALSTEFPDERLKLLFVCAHPAIDPAMHTPLMLQTALGLDAARIAQSFLTAPKTMGQRLFRAKTKSAAVVFRSKSRKSVNCRSALTPCWKRFTPPSGSAGTTWRAPTSAGAIWPKKPSGSRGSFCSSCPAKPRFRVSWLSCSIAKHDAPREEELTVDTFLFPSRTPSNGRFR